MIGKLFRRKKRDCVVITKNELGNLLINGKLSKYGVTYKVENDYNNMCWLCGKKKITKHHVIPKCLHPLFNITIPVCRDCHDLLHDMFTKNEQIKRIIDSRSSLQANKIIQSKYKNLIYGQKSLSNKLNNTRKFVSEVEKQKISLMMENRLLKRLIEGDLD
jgi:hypothetical protein